ncbi:GntR family transcriptional regulator [Brevibacterium album]|uniref:GntR family transcriptional regulator n=1 Tax=Brevibacterium album TaxID=417948 RepID=UPI00040C8BEB|nr:GntR family transcriptional regulator [Brevibacterium album]
MHPSPPRRGDALGDQVADDLRRQIVTRGIEAGASLVETRLAEIYQVSRGPVRDALRILANEGLVETSGRSVRVLGLTREDIDELFRLRLAMEQMALTEAFGSRREGLLALLRSAIADMEAAVAAGDPAAFTLADLTFHSAFGTASGLRRVQSVWSQYRGSISNLLLVANLDHIDLQPSLKKHQQLLVMIEDGNDDAALAELAHHVDASRVRVREHFTDAQPDHHPPVDPPDSQGSPAPADSAV